MASGNSTDGTITLCPCGCGIPITTKKGIRYKDAKDDRQLIRHFEGMKKLRYKNRVKAFNEIKKRYRIPFTFNNPPE